MYVYKSSLTDVANVYIWQKIGQNSNNNKYVYTMYI